jgi:virginiamycin B lyase
MWFPVGNGTSIEKMTMSGNTTEYTFDPLGCGGFLATGGDGNIYSGSCTNVIRTNTSGVVQTFAIPSGDETVFDGFAPGPDGNVWFVEEGHIGRITPSGAITEYRYPSLGTGEINEGITAGPDGKMWFFDLNASPMGAVANIDPSSGVFTEYPIPRICVGPGSSHSIVAGADGNLYFDCGAYLGKVTTGGNFSEIATLWTTPGNPEDLAVGPDNGIWFVSNQYSVLGEYNYTTNTVTAYMPPSGGNAPFAIVAGLDGNMWATAPGGKGQIDVYVLKVLTVYPKKLKFTSDGQTLSIRVTEHGVYKWTAVSSNQNVATVAKGPNAHTFEVTSVGSGTCVVTIADNFGNSFNVKVTVL